MRSYKINPAIKHELRRVLKRGYYACSFYERNGVTYCKTNCSSNAFHKLVKRAYCDKKTAETGIFQVTLEEARDAGALMALLNDNKVTAFQIIDDPGGSRLLAAM